MRFTRVQFEERRQPLPFVAYAAIIGLLASGFILGMVLGVLAVGLP